MGIIDKVTKALFGLRTKTSGESDAEEDIRDGVLIASDSQESTQAIEDDLRVIFNGEGTLQAKYEQKTERSESTSKQENTQQEVESEKDIKRKFKVSEAERGFLLWLTVGNRAERTKQEYIWEIRWWQKRAKRRKKALHELTAQDIESCLRRVKPAAAIRKIAALKTWARWQLREGNGNLFMEIEKVIRPKSPKPLPKDLGPEKFRELMLLAQDLIKEGKRDGVWIGLMLCGGLRISEIKTCRPYQNGVKVIGKGSKERYVPLPDWLLEGMQKIRRRPPNGWAVTRKTITIWLRRNHGLRKLHSLRHTYASELVRRGYKIEEIQKLLGHENIQTTTVYARISVPDDVVERLGM